MKEHKNDTCCKSCQNGQPGTNAACQAKLLMERLQVSSEGERAPETKNNDI